jgi:glycosyltransferase involved in cell wall biosynthesis
MYNDIVVYHNGHFDNNCICSFCLNRRGIIEGLKNCGLNVYVSSLNCNWKSLYPANIHFDYAVKYQNKVFGSFMFEADKFPSKVIDFAEKYFDYIICGSNFLERAWVNSGVNKKYLISSSCGIDTSIYRVDPQMIPMFPGKFKFLTAGAWQGGDWQDRKGMIFTINLFKKLFRNNKDVMLIVKTNNKEALRYGGPGINIITERYSDSQMARLYQSCAKEGALIHPHKGEGFGRMTLEALHCGIRIGTTGYSGVLDFADQYNSTLFDYTEIPYNIYGKDFYRDGIVPMFANPNEVDVEKWMLNIVKSKNINPYYSKPEEHTWDVVTKKLFQDIQEKI